MPLLTILFLYSAIILFFAYKWKKAPSFERKPKLKILLKSVTVIVAFRNEEKNLPTLINHLNTQTFRNFSVIFVNDASTDNSEEIIREKAKFSYKIIRLKKHSGKKAALKIAAQKAKTEWLAFTDADSAPHKDWLKTATSFIANTDSQLIFAPVLIEYKKVVSFAAIQALEFAGLNMLSAGSIFARKPIVASAANMFCTKELFSQADLKHEHPSGDDMFLLEFALKNKITPQFIKSPKAVVYTKAQNNIKDFLNQRTRWASKATLYTNAASRLFSVVVILLYTLMFLYFIDLALGLEPSYYFWLTFVLKTTVDIMATYDYLKFFNKQKLTAIAPIVEVFTFIYSTVVGFKTIFGNFEWKGRKYQT